MRDALGGGDGGGPVLEEDRRWLCGVDHRDPPTCTHEVFHPPVGQATGWAYVSSSKWRETAWLTLGLQAVVPTGDMGGASLVPVDPPTDGQRVRH